MLEVHTVLQYQSHYIALLGKLRMKMLPFLPGSTGNVPQFCQSHYARCSMDF